MPEPVGRINRPGPRMVPPAASRLTRGAGSAAGAADHLPDPSWLVRGHGTKEQTIGPERQARPLLRAQGDGTSLWIARGVRAVPRRRAPTRDTIRGASLPPVLVLRPHLGRERAADARTDRRTRRPYNDGASLPARTAMRRRALLVRVLAARSRPVIPLGRERTAERGQRLSVFGPESGKEWREFGCRLEARPAFLRVF